jgi:hypothetical protein
MRTIEIARDPFARSTLMRAVDKHGHGACKWCGQGARFIYWWEKDGVSATTATAPQDRFCSIGCYRTYSE